eukprot:4014158-Heterocapsa_arctica.AAC.1
MGSPSPTVVLGSWPKAKNLLLSGCLLAVRSSSNPPLPKLRMLLPSGRALVLLVFLPVIELSPVIIGTENI